MVDLVPKGNQAVHRLDTCRSRLGSQLAIALKTSGESVWAVAKLGHRRTSPSCL